MRAFAAALGKHIGSRPLLFLTVPLVLVCLLAGPFILGLQEFRRTSLLGNINLFLPDDLESAPSRSYISKIFPDGGYFANRDFLADNLLIVIASSRQHLSIFHPTFVAEYARLRAELDNVGFVSRDRNQTWLNSYARVCAQHTGSHCRPDAFLALWHAISVSRQQYDAWDKFVNKSRDNQLLPPPRLTYPVVKLAADRQLYVGPLFGDVVTDESGEIEHARYVRMIFDLPPDLRDQEKAAFGRAWVKFLEQYTTNQTAVDVVWWNPRDYQYDLTLTGQRTRKWLSLLATVLVLFSALSCCMVDNVLSKPWLAIGGVISAACGVLCAQAVLHLCNVPLIQIAMIVPFLVMSIGIDDMFVLLNVWRKSDPSLSVMHRLRDTYAESAVSISITTLTDSSVFFVGLFSRFEAIRIFCAHCFLAIVVVFMFQLVMFGALMALSGYREQQHRHALLLYKVSPDDPSDRSFLGCTSLLSNKPWQNVYFRTWHSRLLGNVFMQTFIAVSYVGYVAFSVWSLGRLQQGLRTHNLVPYDTHTYSYSLIYDGFFTRYSTSAEVVLSGYDDRGIDVYRSDIQRDIFSIVNRLENTPHTIQTQHFWLRDFLRFLQVHTVNENSTAVSFYDSLTGQFLKVPAFAHYKSDIIFDDRRLVVEHMRLFIPLTYMDGSNRSETFHLLKGLMEKLNMEHQSLRTYIYDVSFPLAEQYDAIGTQTTWNVAVAGLGMLVIALVFIPNVICCVAVACTVLSINVGVLALLSALDVNLDIISNITILLSIGFSVDFSSHVTYHFHHARGNTIPDRLSATLETVGWPIVQSSLSTLLGVLTLTGVQSYITATFVKTVVLVMLVGVYHGLFLLPLLLCAIQRFCCCADCWWTTAPKNCQKHTSNRTRTYQVNKAAVVAPVVGLAPVAAVGMSAEHKQKQTQIKTSPTVRDTLTQNGTANETGLDNTGTAIRTVRFERLRF